MFDFFHAFSLLDAKHTPGISSQVCIPEIDIEKNKITSILKGEGDVYISYSLPSGTCPRDWDIAAPASLIKGAGGFFTDINGKELEFLNEGYNQRGILIASLNKNHFEICRAISNIVNT